ncbi:MAG TPA: DUF4236 domain-containing protein [Candidatus Saccharimonadales bacterium]|nr:DUF4236 domain-containing protein [Candidatus Saccharimonadales bacterium]
MRYRKSIKIIPGVKVNLTKTGIGATFGVKGAHYSVHSGGRRTTSIGLPGTGMYYQTTHVNHAATPHLAKPEVTAPTIPSPATATVVDLPGPAASAFPSEQSDTVPELPGAVLYTVKGYTGIVSVGEGWLALERKGIGKLQGIKGYRVIDFSSLKGIHLQPATILKNGYVFFNQTGVIPPINLQQAIRDRHSVIFIWGRQQKKFEKLKSDLETSISIVPVLAAAPVDPPQQSMQGTVSQRLSELRQLYDSRLITKAEYEHKRLEIINQI